MKIDREEDKCFYLRFAYAFISHSVSKRISKDSMQKSSQK